MQPRPTRHAALLHAPLDGVDRSRVALHAYQTLSARQDELEAALLVTLASFGPRSHEMESKDTPGATVPVSVSLAQVEECMSSTSTRLQGPQEASLDDRRRKLQQCTRADLRTVKAAMQTALLITTSAFHSSRFHAERGGAGAVHGLHPLARDIQAHTRLPPSPSVTANARADYRSLLAAARQNMAAEWDTLSREEAALASVPAELERLVAPTAVQHQRREARALAQHYRNSAATASVAPTVGSCDAGERSALGSRLSPQPGSWDRETRGGSISPPLHQHPQETSSAPTVASSGVTYTGARLAEWCDAVEASYRDFLDTYGGLTLGWPDDLHEAFLRTALRVQSRVRHQLPINDSSVSADAFSVFAHTSCSTTVTSPFPAPRHEARTRIIPFGVALLAAAKEVFHAIVKETEIVRHVELYLRYEALARARAEVLAAADTVAERTEVGRGVEGGNRADLLPGRRTLSPPAPSHKPTSGCEVPWPCCRGPVSSVAVALAKAEAAHQRRARAERIRRKQTKQQVAEWRARQAEEKAAQLRAETVAASPAARCKTNSQVNRLSIHIAKEERASSPLERAPSRSSSEVSSLEKSTHVTHTKDAFPAIDGSATPNPEVSFARLRADELRKRVRQLSREVLRDRRQRDLEATRARRERIAAAKAYEEANTKEAVGKRYLAGRRGVSSRADTGASDRSGLICGSPMDGVSASGALLRAGPRHRHRDPTASRIQHVLPSEEARSAGGRTVDGRAQWLSRSRQELRYAHGLRE